MSQALIIFGAGSFAELACQYFVEDSAYEVVAFTVDAEHLTQTELLGRPVVPFEDLTNSHPPSDHALFVATGYTEVNALRREKVETARSLGYTCATYVSSRAVVMPDVHIGANCFVFEGCVIQPFVTLGDGVIAWSGGHVGHHSTIGDFAFLAPRVAIPGNVGVGAQCFIGTNATLRDGISVGERCVVGAGAVLLSDAEPGGVYIGSETVRAGISSDQLRSI